MKIIFEDIPDSGLQLDVSEEAARIGPLLHGIDAALEGPVTAHLEAMRTDEGVYLTGHVSARLRLICSRCVSEYKLLVEPDFSLYYVVGIETDAEQELHASDLEVTMTPVPELDTDDILVSQIAVELPMKPLCTDKCKGLCVKCGVDRNKEECDCVIEEPVDARFAALKGFKPK
ncbi:MAG: DUF177 domain-containing protein [Proteobacteria bacterium]|nr:DUF177 domain-containing protein [Pseudomonadota bacterium]